jgi:hypothetical protein
MSPRIDKGEVTLSPVARFLALAVVFTARIDARKLGMGALSSEI